MSRFTTCGDHGWNTEPEADGSRWCPECTPSRMSPSTVPEAAARAAVARDLADALAKYQPRGADVRTVKALPPLGWQGVAEAAGCEAGYVPSMATRVTVVRMLERREQQATTDPFAGFPQ